MNFIYLKGFITLQACWFIDQFFVFKIDRLKINLNFFVDLAKQNMTAFQIALDNYSVSGEGKQFRCV